MSRVLEELICKCFLFADFISLLVLLLIHLFFMHQRFLFNEIENEIWVEESSLEKP